RTIISARHDTFKVVCPKPDSPEAWPGRPRLFCPSVKWRRRRGWPEQVVASAGRGRGTREREGAGHSRRFGADHAGTRREEGRGGRKPPREAAIVAGFGSLVARDEQ